MITSVATAGIALAQPASAAPEALSSCTTIDESGEYSLTSDIDAGGETCFTITASDVTLDGNGHTIAGAGGNDRTFGVFVDGTSSEVSNVTVTDLSTTRWFIGYHVRGSSDVTVSDTTAVDNKYYGYWLHTSEDVRVEDAIARDHTRGEGEGVSIIRGSNLVLDNVTAVNNDYGIHIDNDARDIRLVDSTISNNSGWGYYMRGYNDGSQPANVTATDLTLGEAVVDIEASQNVVLEGTDSLPAASESGQPVGAPLRTSTAGGGASPVLNLSVHYGDDAEVDESTLELRQYDQSSGEWSVASSDVIDADANTVTTPIEFTSTGTIYLSLVGEAAADGGEEPEPEPEPASVEVTNLDAPANVTQGERAAVNVTVTNTGGVEATQTVEFRMDIDLDGDGTPETVTRNESVTLAPNASQTVTFAGPTDSYPVGTYTYEVSTENDSVTSEVTIDAPAPEPDPATFAVTSLDAPTNVTQGERAAVNVTVTNTGGVEATQTVEFRMEIDFDGDGTSETVTRNESVTLAPNASQTVTFAGPTDSYPVGTYTYEISTENDSVTSEVTIDAPEPEPTASVTFDNQTSDGTNVTVGSVTMSEGGFVTIHAADGSVIGVSDYLSAGTHEDVGIALYEDVPGANFSDDASLENGTLIAMPHLDTNGNEAYDFVASNGEADGPYTANGSAVVDPAQITVEREPEPETVYYQVDFVAGEPLDELGGDAPLYAEQDRLMRFAHGNTDAGITEKGSAWASEDVREAVDYGHISTNDDGTASVTFTVADGENVTLSLAVYEKPGAGFDASETQTLIDASTETFGPGEHTITVELPDENGSDDGNATADLGAGPAALAA